MLIDFHCHMFPDAVAKKAIPLLSDTANNVPYSDGTVRDLSSKMKLWRVDNSVILNIATNYRQQHNVNEFARSLIGTEFIPFGSVHPDSPCPEKEIAELRSAGIKGIKLHPDYMKTPFDDKRFDAILSSCEDQGIIVVTHAGYDAASPDFIHCTPERILNVIKRYPKLKLVCAHMGGARMWDEVLKKLCGKDIYFDTSYPFSLSSKMMRDIIKTHGADRILFGSDMPWCPPPFVSAALDRAEIDGEEREKINYKNAKRLLDL